MTPQQHCDTRLLMSENVRALGELQSGEASSSETVEAAAAGDRFAAMMEAAQAGKAGPKTPIHAVAPRNYPKPTRRWGKTLRTT